MELITQDNTMSSRLITLRKYKLQIKDNIINPFEDLSAEYEYLETSSNTEKFGLNGGLHIIIDN